MWCAGFSLWWLLLCTLGHVGFRSCSVWALEHRLTSRGPWAQLLHSMWDLSRSGIKPVSPSLAGRCFTTEPPGEPMCFIFKDISILFSKQTCFKRESKFAYHMGVLGLYLFFSGIKIAQKFFDPKQKKKQQKNNRHEIQESDACGGRGDLRIGQRRTPHVSFMQLKIFQWRSTLSGGIYRYFLF